MTRTIAELVADLSSPDGVLRDQSLGMLVSYGQRATAELVALLDTDDVELRGRAVRALAYIADPTTADRLAQLVGDPDPTTRAHAALGLSHMRDPRALEALIETIDDLPADTLMPRTLATDGLIAMGEPALPRVADLLAAPSPETRARARLVILMVTSRLPPAQATAWRDRVAAAEQTA